MTEPKSDRELLRDFTASNSESAFEALVQRHVDLVFATAMRGLSDAAAAQEVTQDVFIALARKAAWLGGEVSLAGWLYKTALLKIRQHWRGEIRRQHREQTAVELNTTMKDGDSLSQAMAAVLDEGLMELRETERQILLLRFFEGRSHREIGSALGIAEDAARKRVDKALGQLTGFFRKRGYAVATTSVAAATLNAAALSAPAGLAPAVAHVAFAHGATGALPVLTRWLMKLFRMSAAQTALVCTVLVLAPALWQGARWRSLGEEQRRMEALLAELQAQQQTVARDETEIRRQLRRASNSLAQLNARSAYLAVFGAAKLDPRLFRWDEAADYVRVPKGVLQWLAFENPDEKEGTFQAAGRVSPTLLGALGLTGEEQARMQQFYQSQLEAYRSTAESRSYLTNPPVADPQAKTLVPMTEDTRAWVSPALSPEESRAVRAQFEQGLTQLLGAERAQIALRDAGDDGSLNKCFQHFGSDSFMIGVTPLPEGGCRVGVREYLAKEQYRWRWTSRIPFSSVLDPGGEKPTALERIEMDWALGPRPLPAALADYLTQWRATHPDVPDKPAKP